MTENSMEINGVKYVREDSIEHIEFNGEKSIASRMIGKNVIVRSSNEGINAGTVVIADETGIELKNCRRIWFHKPKDKDKSWYEGVAISGLSDDSKVSCTVDKKVIIEKYSMTLCRDNAFKSIMEIKPNAQG
jgi:hypothetical protein